MPSTASRTAIAARSGGRASDHASREPPDALPSLHALACSETATHKDHARTVADRFKWRTRPTTHQWSPASSTRSMSQPIQAITSSEDGHTVARCLQPIDVQSGSGTPAREQPAHLLLMMTQDVTQKLPMRLSGTRSKISCRQVSQLGAGSADDVNEPMMRPPGRRHALR